MVDAPAGRDDAVVQELREAGLRVTMAPQAVLTWLTLPPDSTADAIAEGVRDQFAVLSRHAIYGVPAACTDGSLLRRVGDNHHGSTAGTQYHEEEWQ